METGALFQDLVLVITDSSHCKEQLAKIKYKQVKEEKGKKADKNKVRLTLFKQYSERRFL